MRMLLGIIVGLIIITAAYAQQTPGPPRPFVPFTIEQSDLTQIQTYLNDVVPKRYADQILGWLDSLEQRAQQKLNPTSTPEPEKK